MRLGGKPKVVAANGGKGGWTGIWGWRTGGRYEPRRLGQIADHTEVRAGWPTQAFRADQLPTNEGEIYGRATPIAITFT